MLSRDLGSPARFLLAGLLLAVFGAGCRSHRIDDAKSGPEVIYQRAQKSIKNGDFTAAIKQLEGLQSRFPFSESARQAQLDLIYAYYRNRETDPATDAADTFIRENPTNLRVDYAYYMKGLINFERQPNFMERWFRADLSKRPPTNARKSFDAFNLLLQKYPHSQYAADARQRMIFLRNRLADFEYHVAEYYMRRGAYVGAINRARFCIENFDGAPAVQPSLQILIDAYRRLGMLDLAATTEKVYDSNYPLDARLVTVKRHWWQLF